ncbi:hypothetical protein [Paenibacillus sp. P13VS]|nr:hypothetical protein [Paenibacillus sp. P13VS]
MEGEMPENRAVMRFFRHDKEYVDANTVSIDNPFKGRPVQKT